MSLFLTDAERGRLRAAPAASPEAELLAALAARVGPRVASPGFRDPAATTDWWHHAAEYLTDAALVHAVRPDPAVAAWLRGTVLELARRPGVDWGGPPFRHYGAVDPVGTLETAHLAWGLAAAFDLAADLFTAAERAEVAAALREHGLRPCLRYLRRTATCHNWNCVLLAGAAVAAAVLDDEAALAEAVAWFPLAADHFQADGSYGESLQYANYAAYSLVLAREAILRRSPGTALPLEPYARLVHWAAQALLHRRPLAGWGDWPRARSANFGDSAALFRPSGDLLAHLAVHARDSLPREAGLARWLFDTLYFPAAEPPPHDRASFGFVCGFGFLSVILLPRAAAPLPPDAADLPLTAAFSAGDAFARSDRAGATILAARLAAEPRRAVAHLHGDVHGFILVHRRERLLVDAGHSCYRNPGREQERSAFGHNTCTFEVPAASGEPARHLAPLPVPDRPIVRAGGAPRGGEPVAAGGRRLLAARLGPVSVLGSEAGPLYGAPLRAFRRLWLLCGTHVVFVVDRVDADVPVRATWHWLLNDRDGRLELDLGRADEALARRGAAGLRLRPGGGRRSGPVAAVVHDAYHPRPGQLGEGAPGSGRLLRWTEDEPARTRVAVHTLCVDGADAVHRWDPEAGDDGVRVAHPAGAESWFLRVLAGGDALLLEETVAGRRLRVGCDAAGRWSLTDASAP